MFLPASKRIRYFALYWPLQWSLIYCLAFAGLLFYYLKHANEAVSYTNDVLQLGGRIALVFLLFLPSVSLLTLMGAFFFIVIKRNTINVSWHTDRVVVNRLVQPLLGFVRVHLLNDKIVCSESLLLLPDTSTGLGFLYGSMASASLQITDRVRAETLDGIVLHFEDPFRFFSFSFFKSVALEHLQLPSAKPENADWFVTKHPDRETEKTAHAQRRSGDWLHLKSFESGDDVRRIVWALYARHKTLMVRRQDEDHPYGDTLKVYVSFNVFKELEQYAHLFIYTETNYKQRLFALVSGLLNAGILIDWRTEKIPWEKTISVNFLANEITRAVWYTDSAISFEPDLSAPSIVFISSFEEVAHLETLAKRWPDTLFVLIGLLDPLFQRTWRSRIQALWFKPNNTAHTSIFISWWRHPLKRYVLNNEQRLKKVMQLNTKEGGVYV
jgi:hypothetical protein